MTDDQPPYAPSDGPPAIAYGAAGDYDASPGGNDGSVFLADLARAMQVTAGAQRLRINEAADERRQAHIDAIRGRETAQTEELRELAERDVKGIESWATAEIERIRHERQRRIAARKAELERRLEQHHSLIEREISAVEAAVMGYRDEVDRFFGRLDTESDPIQIAREAGNLPPFPVLEVIGPDDAPYVAFDAAVAVPVQPDDGQAMEGPGGSGPDGGVTDEPVAPVVAAGSGAPVGVGEAVSVAAGESAMVGVMSSGTSVPVTVAPWERQPSQPADQAGETGATDAPSGVETPGADADAEAEADPPAVGAGGTKITPRSSGAVIQSVPSLRPIGSWLRRTNHSD